MHEAESCLRTLDDWVTCSARHVATAATATVVGSAVGWGHGDDIQFASLSNGTADDEGPLLSILSRRRAPPRERRVTDPDVLVRGPTYVSSAVGMKRSLSSSSLSSTIKRSASDTSLSSLAAADGSLAALRGPARSLDAAGLSSHPSLA